MQTFTGSITRNSNGSFEFTPASGSSGLSKVEMGSEVEVTVKVVRTAAEIDKLRNKGEKPEKKK